MLGDVRYFRHDVAVYVLFIYGLKSIWLPWVWPTFNQIFLMIFVSAWLRRSNVLTGAEWIQTRFGRGTGANLAHLSVVLFALVNVVGCWPMASRASANSPPSCCRGISPGPPPGCSANANIYAIIILSLTSIYAIKGGMVSVVITEVMQFTILTVTSLIIGLVAMYKVSPDMIKAVVPEGWTNPFFGYTLGLDWSTILPQANAAIKQDGNELFSIIFGLMFFKGVMASLAGPAPNYDMQRILATRNTREASLMSGMVNVVLMFPRYFMIAGITVLASCFSCHNCTARPRRILKSCCRPCCNTCRSASSGCCWRDCSRRSCPFRGHAQRRACLHRQRHL